MHASHGTSEENEEYFKKASEAFNILEDVHLRQIYDREGLEGVHNFQQEEKDRPDLIYSTLGPGVRFTPKNRNSKFSIDATLEEFYFGAVKKFPFTRRVICPTCNGSGHSLPLAEATEESEGICSICEGKRTIEESLKMSVAISPGSTVGSTHFLPGKGSQDDPELEPGNLAVVINQIEHPTFK